MRSAQRIAASLVGVSDATQTGIRHGPITTGWELRLQAEQIGHLRRATRGMSAPDGTSGNWEA
ncbi:hypothetical protein GCM10007977_059010 [Dactylosporangium sucinum]|uniref:Uncharacterized protein n=1 Tax=Dactylosporangium sucinum TaxID=1424081 RepID=A0A917X0Y3_9ACTN|nr:hypothetical protein GCM10007977_059010 [Dactylosporangium sucinum]